MASSRTRQLRRLGLSLAVWAHRTRLATCHSIRRVISTIAAKKRDSRLLGMESVTGCLDQYHLKCQFSDAGLRLVSSLQDTRVDSLHRTPWQPFYQAT